MYSVLIFRFLLSNGQVSHTAAFQAEAPTPMQLRVGACSRSGASAGNQPGSAEESQLAIALGHHC